MSELNATKEGFWQTRYSIIAMCFAATFVCYIDRVNISVAIIPMADDYGWNLGDSRLHFVLVLYRLLVDADRRRSARGYLRR